MIAPEPHPDVICGARETRPDGSWECVERPVHVDRPHVWIRLVRREAS